MARVARRPARAGRARPGARHHRRLRGPVLGPPHQRLPPGLGGGAARRPPPCRPDPRHLPRARPQMPGRARSPTSRPSGSSWSRPPTRPAIEMDLLFLSRHYRCFPGQGDLPVVAMMRKLVEIGYRGPDQPRDLQRRFPRRLAAPDRDRRHALVPLARGAAAPAPDARPAARSAGIEFLEFVDDRHQSRAVPRHAAGPGLPPHPPPPLQGRRAAPPGRHPPRPQPRGRGLRPLVPAPARPVGAPPWRCASTMPPAAVAPCHRACWPSRSPAPSARASSRIPAVRGVGGSLLYFVDGAGRRAPSTRSTSCPTRPTRTPDLGLIAIDHRGPGRAADRVPELDPLLPRHPRPRARRADRPQRPARPDRQPGPDQRRPHPAPAAQRLPGAGLRRRPVHGAHGRCRRPAHRLRLPRHRSPPPTALPGRAAAARSPTTTTRTWPPASASTTRPARAPARRHAILYDRVGAGEFLHFFTRTINGLFFEVLERRGGYDRYGEANAPARLAAQAMLDRTPGRGAHGAARLELGSAAGISGTPAAFVPHRRDRRWRRAGLRAF